MTRGAWAAVALVAGALLPVGGAVVRRAVTGGSGRATAASSLPPAVSASVYDLGLRVQDADGAVRGLDELRGHPVLASMFYGSCTTACPLLIGELKRVAAGAPAGLRDDLRVLLISFDPARDTPAVLADVPRRYGLDVARWRIAVAPDQASARTAAAVLGVRYRPAAQGTFDHTTAVTVLDRSGDVRGRAQDPSAIASLLAGLADQDRTAPR